MDGQGTSRDYLLRRIAKECPELLNDVGKGKRLKSARAAAIALAQTGEFAKSGDNQHTLEEGGPDIIRTLADTGGTSAAYLAARLKKAGRDDLLKQIGPGKQHQSVRSAAIEAGIITPFPSIALKDPAPTAQKLLAKKGKEWCLQLMEELSTINCNFRS